MPRVPPCGSNGKESAPNAGDPGSIRGWGREWLPTPVFLLENFHGHRSLVGYSPWDHRQSDMTERLALTHVDYYKILNLAPCAGQ